MELRKRIDDLRAIKAKFKYVDHPDFHDYEYKPFMDYNLLTDPNAYECAPGIRASTGKQTSTLAAYLSSLYDYGILTKQAEYNLFMRYNYLKYLIYRRLQRLNDQSSIKELEITERYLQRTIEIRNILVNHNLRLVVSIVKYWPVTNEKSIEDWISDGNFWLINTIDNFNPMLGNKFSTYLSRALTMNSWRRRQRNLPMDSNDIENLTIVDECDQIDIIETADIIAKLLKVVQTELNERERYVISARYGINNHTPQTLQEVGTKLKVTRERIRQIQTLVVSKLYKALDDEKERIEDNVNCNRNGNI